MSNRNIGVLILIIAIATAAIVFAVFKNQQSAAHAGTTTTAEAAPVPPADIEPAAGKESKSEEAPPSVNPSGTADDPVVATVDGQNILRSEALNFAKNFPPQLQQAPIEQLFPLALEQVISAKIVDEKAAKQPELASDPEVTKRLAEAKIQIIRTVFLEKEIEKQVTDDRLQKAYDKFKSQQGKVEEVHARHILVDKEDTAKEIIKKLAGGAKFEDLAKQYSKDPSNKDTGGDLGYFAKDAMVKEFADAAFALKKGEVSKSPVKTQFGYHVIQALDKRTRPVPTFEEIKPALANEERRQILNEIVANWRKKADVTTLDINGKPIVKAPAQAEPAAK